MPTLSDAPVECPSCRKECFGDPETGEPIVHRLFIDFGEGEAAASSQAGIVPAGDARATQRDADNRGGEVNGSALILARRARHMIMDVDMLGPSSLEAEMEKTLVSAEALEKDLVSHKALAGVQVCPFAYIPLLVTNNDRNTSPYCLNRSTRS
jgi:hypothetical protein